MEWSTFPHMYVSKLPNVGKEHSGGLERMVFSAHRGPGTLLFSPASLEKLTIHTLGREGLGGICLSSEEVLVPD